MILDGKTQLLEGYSIASRAMGMDPTKPDNLKELLSNDAKFDIYMEALSESMDPQHKESFMALAENTRLSLLERITTNSLNPYSVIELPLLSVFYPRLVAKDAVTVIPMDKPDIFRGFLKPYFEKYNPSTRGYDTYQAPNGLGGAMEQGGISAAPRASLASNAKITLPAVNDTSIISLLGLTQGIDHLQRDFTINRIGYTDDPGDVDPSTNPLQMMDVSIVPDINGTFSHIFTINGQAVSLAGTVNYENATVSVSATSGHIKELYFTVTASLEENNMNSYVKFNISKYIFTAKDRQISAEWSLQAQQDAKALYDMNLQSELVSIMGNQIAMDIDTEIINHLITIATQGIAPSSNIKTFSKTPSSGFAFGVKQWYENISVPLSSISASIYNATHMGSGNIILANPEDASIFEATSDFKYVGDSANGGDAGYSVGTMKSKWKVLVSANVPKGKMPIIYKSPETLKATYIYAPYVPGVISPYPLGNKPSLTLLTRYDNKVIRPEGIGLLNIVD